MADDTEPKLLNDGGDTVALYNGETQVVTEDEAAVFETADGYAFATLDGTYQVNTDEDGWLVLSGTEPEALAEFLRGHESLRFAEADYDGFPITFDVEYRSENALFRAAWQDEQLRPSDNVAEQLQSEAHALIATVTVDETASITITDLRTWPSSSNVTIDL